MILGLIIGRGPQSLLINFLSLCHVYIYYKKKIQVYKGVLDY
jgi:hypothetical protein